MKGARPSVVIIGGPNGAGKSTAGPPLLRDLLGIRTFVNADRIAEGLAAYNPEAVAFSAGRIMLERIGDLILKRETFAFETTLAARTFAPRIRKCLAAGYDFHLVYLWLPSAAFAIDRVAARVMLGGHGVPPATIKRRYKAGLRNFFGLYRSMATSWRIYDTSQCGTPRLIANGARNGIMNIRDADGWKMICKGAK